VLAQQGVQESVLTADTPLTPILAIGSNAGAAQQCSSHWCCTYAFCCRRPPTLYIYIRLQDDQQLAVLRWQPELIAACQLLSCNCYMTLLHDTVICTPHGAPEQLARKSPNLTGFSMTCFPLDWWFQ
jgi:hypothetical protein